MSQKGLRLDVHRGRNPFKLDGNRRRTLLETTEEDKEEMEETAASELGAIIKLKEQKKRHLRVFVFSLIFLHFLVPSSVLHRAVGKLAS